MASTRKYSDADVRAIIAHALDNEAPRDASHEELVSIASEVGVSRESIEQAARDLDASRALDSAKLAVSGRRRRYLVAHAVSFLIVNLFLFVVNYATTPGEWWVAFPVAIWGLVLVFHALMALSRPVSSAAILDEQRRTGALRSAYTEERARGQRLRLEANPEGSPELGASQDEETSPEPTQQRRV